MRIFPNLVLDTVHETRYYESGCFLIIWKYKKINLKKNIRNCPLLGTNKTVFFLVGSNLVDPTGHGSARLPENSEVNLLFEL